MEKRNPVLDAMERQGILKGEKEGRKEDIEIGVKKGIEEGTLKV